MCISLQVSSSPACEISQADLLGGMLYYDGDSQQASLNIAMAAAMLMWKYAPMASSKDKQSQYEVSLSENVQVESDFSAGFCSIPTRLLARKESDEWYAQIS